MRREKSYNSMFISFLIFIGIIIFLVHNISKFLSNELGQAQTKINLYNMYYALDIQELLNEPNEALYNKVAKMLEDQSFYEITNEDFLNPLPSVWFFSQLTQETEASNNHNYQVASFIKDFQQDNGLFTMEKTPLGQGTELRLDANLFPTKMAIDILQHYGEDIPKQDLLHDVIHKELHNRLNEEKDVALNGYLLRLLQIEQVVHPQTDMIEEARKVISTQQIEEEIQKHSTDPVTIHELIEMATILDQQVKFDADTITEIEDSFNQLQMKNGAFSFEESDEPSILATYYAVEVMNFLAVDIHNKDRLLDYTNKLAEESFIH